MAQAHTGHLTGSDAVHDAVFAQCGIIRVDDLDEIIEISGMFCHAGLLSGKRDAGGVAIYALSGGTASHMVDLCSVAGLSVPRLQQSTIDGLREHIPWFLRCDNPVDSGGTITATPAGRAVLELLVDDANTEVLIVPITGVFPGMSDALANDLVELHAGGRKTIITIWSSPKRDDPAYRALVDAGVPLFHSFGAAVRGAKALVDYSRYIRNRRNPFEGLATKRSTKRAVVEARELLTAGESLDEVQSKRIIAAYGIATVPERIATSAKEAVAAAKSLGLPVVMKALSAAIAHKSDLGLVSTNVRSPAEVRSTYRRLLDQAARVAPDAHVEAVVVQPLVTGAVAEAILGLSHEEPFGPTVMYGLGGVFAEVFNDVAFGVPPFSKSHARSMVESTRGFRLLTGARGRPKGDVAAVVDAIMALQHLALDAGDAIGELDVNPLFVLPKGQGVVAVDALVVPR
jgi:acyl-CoA synthetase (NDP forming)